VLSEPTRRGSAEPRDIGGGTSWRIRSKFGIAPGLMPRPPWPIAFRVSRLERGSVPQLQDQARETVVGAPSKSSGGASSETPFFHHQNDLGMADYSGGAIVKGMLFARRAADGSVDMRCQHVIAKDERMTGIMQFCSGGTGRRQISLKGENGGGPPETVALVSHRGNVGVFDGRPLFAVKRKEN
jgi:hypothetical protein